MATETQDVRTFWQANKYLTKAGFIKTHPYPFLVEIDPKPMDGDSRSFETLASRGRDDREQFKRQVRILSDSRVLRVVKRSPASFGEKISVGRSANNDIVIPHMSVSKFQAYITANDVRFEFSVYDANSKNGTFVNDIPVQPLKPAEIKNGDRVSFGGEIHFLFLVAQDLFTRLSILDRFL